MPSRQPEPAAAQPPPPSQPTAAWSNSAAAGGGGVVGLPRSISAAGNDHWEYDDIGLERGGAGLGFSIAGWLYNIYSHQSTELASSNHLF